MLKRFPNLQVYYNTVVKKAVKGGGGIISEVTAIQRFPIDKSTGYEWLFSHVINDWYQMEPWTKRKIYNKQMFVFRNPRIVIEGTEFADVLVTAGIDISQGVETPTEFSDDILDTCG